MKNFPTFKPVVAVALIDDLGRVLIQKRRKHGQEGGLWEFPGGKVECGESLENALIRELEEELIITVSQSDLHPLAFSSLPPNPYVIMLYTCRHWQGDPRCVDADGLEWVFPDQLPIRHMPPLDQPLVTALTRHLSREL